MTIAQNFQTLTGFTPRQFQAETIAHLLNRQNAILRAPTGSGKTETAIAPFLFALQSQPEFPRKLIYVVPLRTLANSLRQRTEELVRQWEEVRPSSRPLVVTLQTGENPEDPRFEGDIIFCTIDQLLSSFLNIPYSLGRGSANVNAGAIFSAYLVFDEIHLLDAARSLTTTLKLLQQVQGITPFLVMTATLTDEMIATIKRSLNEGVAVVKVSDRDLIEIEGNRQRIFQGHSQPLSAQRIWEDIETHNRQRIIVICNRVSHAQTLYQDLQYLIPQDRVEVTLLHSRFLPADRAAKEEQLKQNFGRNLHKNERICILIATQVIEAGMNITCEVMHVQLCPMNALLQRAGRCARFAGETGWVYVYRGLESEEEGELSQTKPYLPYEKEPCDRTWVILSEHTRSPQANLPVHFRDEEKWINEVHAVEDCRHQQRRQDNITEFTRQFNAAVFQGDRSVASQLIRQVDSRQVYIWQETATVIDFDSDEPEIEPRNLQPFSLPLMTLRGILAQAQQSEIPYEWLFRRIETASESENYALPILTPIESVGQLEQSFQVLVNPRYADYNREVGLQIGIHVEGKGYQSPQKSPDSQKKSEYQYSMDNYAGHLVLMWQCWRKPFTVVIEKNGKLQSVTYQSLREELQDVGGRFLKQYFFPQAQTKLVSSLFEYFVFFAIFCHDLGKLQVKWQEVMKGWQAIAQQQFHGHAPGKAPLAHTDYNPTSYEQRKAMKAYEKRHKRPAHAVESAFLAQSILMQSLVPILVRDFQAQEDQIKGVGQAILMAAGRHHSAWAKGWTVTAAHRMNELILHPQAGDAIANSWRYLTRFLPQPFSLTQPQLCQARYRVSEFPLDFFSGNQSSYYQLYLLVVRALRLCDMRSVQIQPLRDRKR